ncbi:MAG TPA: hypothetical protein VKC57_04030, partial [Ktedonobacterales bacterium]|nr:hypothetical protein [Ktedonobacterales bacterium]
MAQESRESRDAQAATLIERARRILQHEQRTGHADAAVKPGGLEAFIEHWLREARASGAFAATQPAPAGKGPSAGTAPIETLARLFPGYAGLDPMQRTAKVRSALALLDALASTSTRASSSAPIAPVAPHAPAPHRQAPARREPPRFGTPQRQAPRDDAPWPLAAPPPAPPVLTQPRGARTAALAPRPEDEYLLRAPVTAIPGVGATQAVRLKKLDIESVNDLLFSFPREHRDFSKLQKIATLPFNEVCTVLGMIWEV